MKRRSPKGAVGWAPWIADLQSALLSFGSPDTRRVQLGDPAKQLDR